MCCKSPRTANAAPAGPAAGHGEGTAPQGIGWAVTPWGCCNGWQLAGPSKPGCCLWYHRHADPHGRRVHVCALSSLSDLLATCNEIHRPSNTPLLLHLPRAHTGLCHKPGLSQMFHGISFIACSALESVSWRVQGASSRGLSACQAAAAAAAGLRVVQTCRLHRDGACMFLFSVPQSRPAGTFC